MLSADNLRAYIFVLIVAVTAISGILLIHYFMVPQAYVDVEPATPETSYIAPVTEPSEEETVTAEPAPEILPRLAGYFEQNSELVGWIHIPGTNVDYPVLTGNDNDWDFYLHHNFYREEAFEGIPYIWPLHESLDDEMVFVFAHNMADGSMFADVARYTDPAFVEQHSTIEFSSLYAERTFEVVSVFNVWVDEAAGEQFYYHPTRGIDERIDFPYVFYSNWKNEEQFHEFIAISERNALHNTGTVVNYGDRMIALWTCASASPDEMRLIVTAVER